MIDSTSTRGYSHPEPEKPLEVSALSVLVHAARESFTSEQLRYLAHRFDEMAAAKEGAER